MSQDVYKPARGLYRHTSFREVPPPDEEETPAPVERVKEERFYEPFADWLVNELE